MNKCYRFAFAVISVLFLFGCGGGGGSSSENGVGSNPQAKSASIIQFNVQGTSPKNPDDQFPISPNVNAGVWSMDWEIELKGDESSLSTLFQIIMYVSEDSVLSADDPSIYRALCTGAQCLGKTSLLMSCSHKPDSTPICDNDVLDGVFQSFNLETFLMSGIPKEAYIIFTVSATAFTDASTDRLAIPVVFE
ncbi:hypothetical protein MNBD_GAMMA06-2083 [hydrothermal vent metagenome]|uniref:Lipoprotein n=1 Tax=hydrothermal vent metagenome TaxID=652676 RepID=A0A3B0WMP5_9ZZZZ